jgi:hypothetical protein
VEIKNRTNKMPNPSLQLLNLFLLASNGVILSAAAEQDASKLDLGNLKATNITELGANITSGAKVVNINGTTLEVQHIEPDKVQQIINNTETALKLNATQRSELEQALNTVANNQVTYQSNNTTSAPSTNSQNTVTRSPGEMAGMGVGLLASAAVVILFLKKFVFRQSAPDTAVPDVSVARTSQSASSDSEAPEAQEAPAQIVPHINPAANPGPDNV